MNEIDLSALDPEQRARWQGRLEHLPPSVRASLAKNLARIPPDKVARILRENEGTISRLEGKLGEAARKVEQARQFAGEGTRTPARVRHLGDEGHFNTTVQPGDAGSSLLGWIGFALALAAVVAWRLGLLGG